MHFEILVEDLSGKTMLEIIVPKVIGEQNTFRIIPYKGIGDLPKGLKPKSDADKRILLDRLPSLLSAYGKTHREYPDNFPACVILVCDLDKKCLKTFRSELYNVLHQCEIKPKTRFCIAIEEGEAWFLGDINAIRMAYPKTNNAVLNNYVNDSICGTWELLADAIYKGGKEKLKNKGWQAVGKEKSDWAEKISPFMNVEINQSPSFCYFRDKLKELEN